MDRKVVLTMAGAAILGASAFHFYLRGYELELAGGEPRPVVMATRDLALGELVTRAVLDVKQVPEGYLEERHIAGADLERVLGARVTSALKGGGALLWSDLDTMQDGRTLSGLVRLGMRGFALTEREASFDGLLRPGDRVDVVFTPEGEGASAFTLLSNVLVLTVGSNYGQEDGDIERNASGRVTLSVTPEQTMQLSQREGTGRLRLTLRNPQDALTSKQGLALGAPEPGEAEVGRVGKR